jgi:hypothetical protein
MAPEDIKSLPVSVLKGVLFHNHVNARLLIEKSDLVERVTTLITDERRERERQDMFRQMEQEQEQERLRRMETEAETHRERLDELHLDSDPESIPVGFGPVAVHPSATGSSSNIPAIPTLEPIAVQPSVAGSSSNIPDVNSNDVTPHEEQITADTTIIPQPMSGLNSRPAIAMNLERDGLCVVCQDEEANIAIVDCG